MKSAALFFAHINQDFPDSIYQGFSVGGKNR